jgi:hypothetical protein
MTRKIKQYKPIGFGDRPDPDTVEGHLNAKAEAADKRIGSSNRPLSCYVGGAMT